MTEMRRRAFDILRDADVRACSFNRNNLSGVLGCDAGSVCVSCEDHFLGAN